MRTRIKAGVAGAAAVTAAALMVGMPSANSAPQTKSYAYGFSLAGQGKQPYAEYPKGPEKGGADLPAQLGPLASGGVLTVTAGNDQATAKVTDLTLGSALEQLPQELRDGLTQLQAVCDQVPADTLPTQDLLGQVPGALKDVIKTPESLQSVCLALGGGDFTQLASVKTLNTECTGDTGTVEVLNARVFNSTEPLNDSDVAPNSSLLPKELDPLVKITLNRQSTDSKTGGFTVDGLVLEVGGQEVAVLASTTCGETIPVSEPKPQPNTGQPKPAPAPTPVQRSVPVTG